MNLLTSMILTSLVILATLSVGQKKQPDWVQLRQDVPRQVLNNSPVRPKPTTDILHISISMPYRDAGGMQQFVNSVSDPNSPNYRHFASPEEIGQRFGLSADEVKKVTDYLTSQGIKIQLIAKNRLAILAEATVAQAQTAFHTAISEFVLEDTRTNEEVTRFSFTLPPSVPSALGRYISYIGGMENITQPKRRNSVNHGGH